MTVLVTIPCLLTGGTEIQTLSLVKALIASGHKVAVVCYFEFKPEMVKRYEETGAAVHLLSPDGSRPSGLRKTTSFLWKGLKRIIRSESPQVAHVQYMAPGALPIFILRLLGVKKIIATTHTSADIYSPNGLRLIRFLTSHVLSGFQCITESAERSYFGSSHLFDGKNSKHFTIYNSLPDHISLRSEARPPILPGQSITIGVVSRLEMIKGMDLVVPAFAEAAKENPLLKLLIVGDGSLRSQMQHQAEQFGIAPRVEFTGPVPQSELQSQYDRIDILLMPSRSEGFGLTALEGMARGCVPIVADTGGLPELVSDGSDGLVHQPASVTDLSDKINSIVGKYDCINMFQSSAIATSAKFSFEYYQRQIQLLYAQVRSNS